ncbi:MAG: DNA replication/repair protein RecF [Armatimonadota bacterium]
MFLRNIKIENFRNIRELEVEFTSPYNFLFGENAQGKSSFLEALFCLSMGKSYCAQAESEVMRWGSDYAKVSAVIEKQSLSIPVEINYRKQENEARINKNIRINNKACHRAADLIKNTFFIHFSPHDFNLINGGASFRRKFLDFLTTQLYPVHLPNLLTYNKCVAQRNALLKMPRPSINNIAVWNEQLIKTGSPVISKRLSALKKFMPVLTENTRKFFLETESVSALYASSLGDISPDSGLKEICELLRNKLKYIFTEEMRRKMTLLGPHRDDFTIYINNKEARSFASFGQQHALALALKLSQSKLIRKELGQTPVLLLDDCFVGLDKGRKTMIWNMLKDEASGQIFITSPVATELELEKEENLSLYIVKSGEITGNKIYAGSGLC